MNRLLAFVLVLSLCLFGLSVTSPLVFGGAAGQTVNGDTNGDGDRDISDATYYLRWLFQGGPEPVEIVCPVDQGDRVAELEAQLAAANAENEALVDQNTAQAGQLTALQDQLTAANAQVAAQAEQIAELEGQDNSDCSGGFFSQFVVRRDCPLDFDGMRSVAREGAPFDDEECQMLADIMRGENPAFYPAIDMANRIAREREDGAPPEFIAREMERFTRYFRDFFMFSPLEASDWFSWCELECPE
jgi:hypothetical protein